MLLEARAAVVTGGGRGIGAATARSLAEAGVRVVVSARTEKEIREVAESLRESGYEAWPIQCDVTDPDSIRRLADGAAKYLGRVDILVNNAGYAWSAPLKSTRLEDWEGLFAVNVTGTFLCTQAFLPAMVDSGWGRIINVASVAGKVGHPYISAYGAAKHAVVGFTRAMASEVATQGVTVNAVCPGYVDTPLTDNSLARIVEKTGIDEAKAREQLRGASPQNRLMEPEEVAYLVVSLCDERAGGINGQSIVLDGGAVQA